MSKSGKILGHKAYGSIPHLLGSRVGPGDHRIEPGQQEIATVKARDKHDFIIVQEKVDGSCCSVAKVEGQIYALSRAGYLAQTSPFVQHQLFADWVRKNEERFDNLLKEGERAVGEWLAQAHGTRYDLPHEPFVLFDIMTGHERIIFQELADRAELCKQPFTMPAIISVGRPTTIDEAISRLEPSGHGALDPVEGAVWRVERRGRVDFLCKYVRPDKIDGYYLMDSEGNQFPPTWNWRP